MHKFYLTMPFLCKLFTYITLKWYVRIWDYMATFLFHCKEMFSVHKRCRWSVEFPWNSGSIERKSRPQAGSEAIFSENGPTHSKFSPSHLHLAVGSAGENSRWGSAISYGDETSISDIIYSILFPNGESVRRGMNCPAVNHFVLVLNASWAQPFR